MRKIHKYKLKCIGENYLCFKGNFKILSTQLQNDDICIWVEEDVNSNIACSIIIQMLRTGQEVLKDYIYFSTVQVKEFVWHIYIPKQFR